MKRQAGFVLAGVLALSLIMTLAAGGLLLTISAGDSVLENAALEVRQDTIGLASPWPSFTPFEGARVRTGYVHPVAGDSVFLFAWVNFAGGTRTLRYSWKLKQPVDFPGSEMESTFTLEDQRDTVLPFIN
jgi:hypothetical protein